MVRVGGEMQGRVVLVRVPSCGFSPAGDSEAPFCNAPTSIDIISGRASSFGAEGF